MTDVEKISVVILGGDISGPIAAAKLARYLPHSHYVITFISPPALERPEVFAHVPPALKRLHRDLKFKEVDFIKATSATFSLGTQLASEQHGFIPFGAIGPILHDTEFRHVVQSARPNDLNKLMLQARLADEEKFLLPQPSGSILLSGYDYGYHVDTYSYAKLLTERASQLGCHVFTNDLLKVKWEDGKVQSLLLDDGQEVKGDIYFDCSGNQTKLRHSEPNDWIQIPSLPKYYRFEVKPHTEKALANSALTTISSNECAVEFHTQAKTIKLKFSNEKSDDDALFNWGWSPVPWIGNVISMGQSAVSLPPAGGMNLRLIDEQISRFIEFLPSEPEETSLSDEYNRVSDARIRSAADYAILLYHPVQETIEKLAHDWPNAYYKYKYFKSRGGYAATDQDEDCKDQWIAMLLSRYGWPSDQNLMAQNTEMSIFIRDLNEMEKAIEHIVNHASDHREFIARNCAAADFFS